ncbi:hypothetical protein PSTT_16414 [Puccinia striiformis]|uniref:holo-[acyl-carrier-protein] synthase n=1 Tax=Puccinia striiformis TaxID=27350 RepID=A0A2S4UD35_9BASI|nr:hypothetical protein PSTT_16414 [Puccinia striiformis]
MASPIRLSTWIVDISEWEPDRIEWDRILALFSPEIQAKISAYYHRIDAQRSLVGKLLIHKIVSSIHSIPWDQIKLKTNVNGKPYLDPSLVPDRCFNFNISHDGSMVVCSFSESRRRTAAKEGEVSRGNLSPSGGGQDRHEIGVDVMEYKLPRSEKTVAEFRSLLEDHLSPGEKRMVDERSTSSSDDDDNQRSVLDGLLQIWTFKESIIKALGCGLRRELNTISLSNLTHHSDIELEDPLETIEAGRQKDFVLPDRSSNLVVSFDGKEDRNWRFWNVVWTCPTQPSSMKPPSKYILSAAVKSFSPDILSSELIHPVVFKTVSDLLPSY